MKLLCLSLGGILLACSIGLMLTYFYFIPVYYGIATISRGSGNATVYREDNGTPHITADTEEMGYYALGYVQASDRLWQMDRYRRVSQGRLSELFGETTVKVDKLMRNFAFGKLAEELEPRLSSRTTQLLQEYADGVNEWVRIN